MEARDKVWTDREYTDAVATAYKAGIGEVVKTGDALLGDVYWRGKFSTGEIRQFWSQLKERMGAPGSS